MVDFSIRVAGAAIGFRRASKNKEMWTEKCNVVCVLQYAVVEIEKNVTPSHDIFLKVLVRTGTACEWSSLKKIWS